MTCSSEMAHMTTTLEIEIVLSLERIFIKLSNGANMMELVHAQTKLFDTGYARGRKRQTENNSRSRKHTIECVVIPNSAVLLLFHLLMYSDAPSQVALIVENLSCK